MKEIKFRHWNCLLNASHYANGRLAIYLIHATEGDPIAVATVNIPEVDLAPDEVLIKDWSENKGILQTLTDEGIVLDTGKTIPTGYVFANVCKLTANPKEWKYKHND